MNKLNIYRALLFCTVLATTVACDDWLKLEPQDAIIKDKYWKTKEQVEAAVIGCYASLLGTTDNQRSIPELMFLWGEMRGDMVIPNAGALADEVEVINGNILQTNALANWRVFYRTINYCNTVIELAPAVLTSDKTFKESQLQSYLAEVRTIRSLLYFYLVRTFKEVPLKITATTSDADPFEIPKSPEEDILDQIIADLNVAEQSAPLTYGTVALNKGRVTRYFVNAIQADVYLWKEDYENCKVACDKIIKSGQYGLVSGSNWFNSIFVQGNSTESIFELPFDAQKTNPFYFMFNTNTRWMAAPTVLEEVYTVDAVMGLRDVRAEDASLKANGMIWKYLGWDYELQRTPAESYANWIIYRYADILLMKAEAQALTGEGVEALETIAKIRTRARALASSEQAVDADDTQGILQYILDERAREFAFEGKRWFDVLRNARRDNYAHLDLLINVAVKTAPPDRQQSIINKLQDKNSHYLPIFQYELQTNRELVQNSFYAK